MLRRSILVVLMTAACAGGQSPLPESIADTSVRERPLTVEEAAEIIRRRAGRFSRCYEFERLNLSLEQGADYVAQVFVPNDGSAPVVEIVQAAVPGIPTLEDCLLRELRAIQFPAHAGQPFAINVPIKAPR